VDSASSLSSARSGQVYLQSTTNAKVSYDILTGDEINVKGFPSMGKNDLDNHVTSTTLIVDLILYLHQLESPKCFWHNTEP